MTSESDLIARLRAERIPVSVLVEQPISSGHATTEELLREREVLEWRVASAAAEWGEDSTEALVTAYLVKDELNFIRQELNLRWWARLEKPAPNWPDAQPDRRGEMEEIKRRTDIQDLASRVLGAYQHQEPRRQRDVVWYSCWNHEDKTPSLAVYDDGHFHCFACHAHGDCIDLARGAMQLSSFQATMALLGEWSGVTTRSIAIQVGDDVKEVQR